MINDKINQLNEIGIEKAKVCPFAHPLISPNGGDAVVELSRSVPNARMQLN